MDGIPHDTFTVAVAVVVAFALITATILAGDVEAVAPQTQRRGREPALTATR